MKKYLFVFICLAFVANDSLAQYAYPAYRGASLADMMAQDDPYLYRKYRKASGLAGFGLGMTIGGVAGIIIGFATGDKETTTTSSGTTTTVSGTGGAIAGAGLISTLVGTPMMITGFVKRGNVKRLYLREYGDVSYRPSPAYSPYLKINPSLQHIGLAYVF